MNYEISTIKKNESQKLKYTCPILYPNRDYKTFTTIFSRYLKMIENLSLYNYHVDTFIASLRNASPSSLCLLRKFKVEKKIDKKVLNTESITNNDEKVLDIRYTNNSYIVYDYMYDENYEVELLIYLGRIKFYFTKTRCYINDIKDCYCLYLFI